MEETDNPGAEVFAHRNNLSVGNGRVLWAPATTDTSGNPHAEGWVLPGGRRTQDPNEARAACARLAAFGAQA